MEIKIKISLKEEELSEGIPIISEALKALDGMRRTAPVVTPPTKTIAKKTPTYTQVGLPLEEETPIMVKDEVTAAAETPEVKELTVEEVQLEASKLARKGVAEMDKARKILSKYGASSISKDLKPEYFKAFVTDIQEVLNNG